MSKKKKESKTKKSKGRELKKELRNTILELLDSQAGKAYSIKQLIKKLGLKKRDDIKEATLAVYALEDDGAIKQLNNGSFVSDRKAEELTGIVDHVSSRFA